jgi:hypothetical protein
MTINVYVVYSVAVDISVIKLARRKNSILWELVSQNNMTDKYDN